MKIDNIHYKIIGFILILTFVLYVTMNILYKEEFTNPSIENTKYNPLSKLFDIDTMCNCNNNLNWKCFWRQNHSNSLVKYDDINNCVESEPLLYDGIHIV